MTRYQVIVVDDSGRRRVVASLPSLDQALEYKKTLKNKTDNQIIIQPENPFSYPNG